MRLGLRSQVGSLTSAHDYKNRIHLSSPFRKDRSNLQHQKSVWLRARVYAVRKSFQNSCEIRGFTSTNRPSRCLKMCPEQIMELNLQSPDRPPRQTSSDAT